ncbi:zinc-binding dehydrogenase [Streptomyces sp. NPDC007903]|uniref:zinc-binding dehydrogenase n=1 Tax=Streptomyces sp. NPDC007903 TaxID=3364786 RepID=UPI0036F15161
MDSARVLGAEKVIAIDKETYRLGMAAAQGYTTINFEDTDVRSALLELTGGRGPDKCIDAVGLEATHGASHVHLYDRAKQAVRSETDRPHALRQAILSCRSGGVVSVIGVYGGMIDKFPAGAWMNRSLTLRTGQCPVQKYMKRLLVSSSRARSIPPGSSPTGCPCPRHRPAMTCSRTRRTAARRSSSSREGRADELTGHNRSLRWTGTRAGPPFARGACSLSVRRQGLEPRTR